MQIKTVGELVGGKEAWVGNMVAYGMAEAKGIWKEKGKVNNSIKKFDFDHPK